MATRRLARVIVEGGRTGGSKYERKLHARARRRTFQVDEDGEPDERRPRRWSGVEFADRLAVLRRWLERHVGQSWSEVYREFCRTAGDRRTMKSWHLHDHLKGYVCCAGFQDFFYIGANDQIHRGFCCRDGFLRDYQNKKTHRYNDSNRREKGIEAQAWAAGRLILARGAHLFWTADPRPLPPSGDAWPDMTAGGWARQGKRLLPNEEKKFRSYPLEIRKQLIHV